ncbi:MAG: zinc dependent phospholipase C family protein [Anaerolineae bacterium]
MPLPMVHLTVATAMVDDLAGPWVPGFLLGNLAPDAIHMRDGATPDDKRLNHLFLTSGDGSAGAAERVQDLLARWADLRSGVEPLILGYATHLLTDLRWREKIWFPLIQRLPADLSREQERTLYYRETDEVDRLLFETAAWRPEVWRLLTSATATDVPGMVTAAEVGLWRHRTLHWFEHLAPAPEPLAYLSLEMVQDFARDTAQQVAEWLEQREYWPVKNGFAEDRP